MEELFQDRQTPGVQVIRSYLGFLIFLLSVFLAHLGFWGVVDLSPGAFSLGNANVTGVYVDPKIGGLPYKYSTVSILIQFFSAVFLSAVLYGLASDRISFNRWAKGGLSMVVANAVTILLLVCVVPGFGNAERSALHPMFWIFLILHSILIGAMSCIYIQPFLPDSLLSWRDNTRERVMWYHWRVGRFTFTIAFTVTVGLAVPFLVNVIDVKAIWGYAFLIWAILTPLVAIGTLSLLRARLIERNLRE